MSITYPGPIDLRQRLRRACLDEEGKPLVFMIGAGASGAVPSTREMVDFFQRSISSDPEDLADFHTTVETVPNERRYQAGARFLIDRAGIGHLNRVVRLAVLRARTPPLPPQTAKDYTRDEGVLRTLEEDYRGWALPRGITSVGRILAMLPPDVRGPILTTNFDPLLEVSLRAAGVEPIPLAVDGDGAVAVPESSSVVVPVIHLHGSWRMGDTLHTSAQLTAPRPKLLGTLRKILSNSTCVVLGYGGWDDVLTSTILQVVNEGSQRELEVLWACHSKEPDMGIISNESLPGRIQPYVSVEANAMLSDLEKALAGRIRPVSRGSKTSPRLVVLAGFLTIDSQFLSVENSRTANRTAALAYFDGREPSWFDVVSGRVPVLSHAERLLADLSDDLGKRAILLIGPTGEGKTTILRQAAARLATSDRFHVLWAEPGAKLGVDELAEMPITTTRTLLFIDNADLRIAEISDLLTSFRNYGREDIRLILAARDTDWQRSLRMSGKPVMSLDLDERIISGLSMGDAELIVEAWSQLGAVGLGRLAHLSTKNARVAKLHEESLDADSSALLGAMLSVRYGGEFRNHIGDLLKRLQRTNLPGGGTLLDAYVTVCLLPSIGLAPAMVSYLAWMFKMSVNELQVLVVDRLGREAAATRHGDRILPRHNRIAAVTLELSEEFGMSTERLLAEYVSTTVREVKGRRWDQDIIDVAFCGQQIADERLAVAAVDGAVSGDPSQLRLRSSQIGVYREFGRVEVASRLCRETWEVFDLLVDTRIAARPFLREWARCEGMQGLGRASAALNACALLDLPGVEELDRDGACRSLSGLALSLGLFEMKRSSDSAMWRGVLAEEALTLSESANVGEVGRQAERTLEHARHDGYRPPGSSERRDAISAAIKFSMSLSQLGPVRRHHGHGQRLDDLFSLLRL